VFTTDDPRWDPSNRPRRSSRSGGSSCSSLTGLSSDDPRLAKGDAQDQEDSQNGHQEQHHRQVLHPCRSHQCPLMSCWRPPCSRRFNRRASRSIRSIRRRYSKARRYCGGLCCRATSSPGRSTSSDPATTPDRRQREMNPGACEVLSRGRLRCNREREKHENEHCGESYQKSRSEGAQHDPAVRFHRRWRRATRLRCCAAGARKRRRPLGSQG
jgi:hypothetical protein